MLLLQTVLQQTGQVAPTGTLLRSGRLFAQEGSPCRYLSQIGFPWIALSVTSVLPDQPRKRVRTTAQPIPSDFLTQPGSK